MTVPTNIIAAQGLGNIGADLLNSYIQTVVSVAALRTFPGTGQMEVFLQGTASQNDGGQGPFVWSATSTATDDGGVTTVQPSNTPTGRWLRVPIGPYRVVPFIINGNGSIISTGSYVGHQFPFPVTINGVTLLADQTTDAQVDLWITPYAGYPPTIANSICAADLPTIMAGLKYQDTTLTGWTKYIPANSTLWYNLVSVSAAGQLGIYLSVSQ